MTESLDVEPGEAKLPNPRFSRRWLQFGFSTLFKLVALAAVLSAWWADRERLTDRIGRLENDQSVLRIAVGDDDTGAARGPWPVTLPSGPGTYGTPQWAPPPPAPLPDAPQMLRQLGVPATYSAPGA